MLSVCLNYCLSVSTTVCCPQLLSACLNYCLPVSTTVRPQLLFALNYCLPSTNQIEMSAGHSKSSVNDIGTDGDSFHANIRSNYAEGMCCCCLPCSLNYCLPVSTAVCLSQLLFACLNYCLPSTNSAKGLSEIRTRATSMSQVRTISLPSLLSLCCLPSTN